MTSKFFKKYFIYILLTLISPHILMASEYDYNWELSASETNINVGLLKQSEVKNTV